MQVLSMMRAMTAPTAKLIKMLSQIGKLHTMRHCHKVYEPITNIPAWENANMRVAL
jgi:hypothetical protein